MSMDDYCHDYSDVWAERTVRARVEHRCQACDEIIPPGDRYTRIGSLYDGSWETIIRCGRCEKIYKHLAVRCAREKPDMYTATLLDCGLSYESEWGECPPEIAALAFELPEDRLGA